MGQGREELVYQDIGNWRAEEAIRDDPREDMVANVGSKRRTSFTREALIEDGPAWKDGSRRSWYVTYSDLPVEVELVSVQTATELANLPAIAIPLQVFINLATLENPALAEELTEFLDEEAKAHTAHHTAGADIGPRLRALSRQAQLSYSSYQDSKIGQGITIPPVIHRPRNPATVVTADGVTW